MSFKKRREYARNVVMGEARKTESGVAVAGTSA
jgi:hypothetical protein